MSEKSFNTKNIYSVLSFVIPFFVYLITLAPTVSWVDSDELATASSLLRIAHPTGYPLFTILGKVFTLFPFGDEVYMLNIMSSVISSAAVLVFFNLMVFLFTGFKLTKSDKLISYNFPLYIIYNISLAAALILAFSKNFWDNANVAEVYSLHSFFIILLIFLFLKANTYYAADNDMFSKNEKYRILFAFVLGLSLANHLSTLFLSTGFIYLYFSNYGFNKASLKHIMFLSVPFIGGLTLYIYLFVRADISLLSWGHTFNIENFIAHITGRQYNTAMFSSFENLKIQIFRFFNEYPKEFIYLNILIIPGIIALFIKSRKLFYFTLIHFVSCVVFASNYKIYDIYSYYLLTSVITSMWIGFGIFFILDKIRDHAKAISCLSVLTFLIPLSFNFSQADKSKDYIVKDYVFNLFNSAPVNSIIISNYNPTYYFQYVKKVRPDIIFINRDYLYNKWYLNSITATYPEIYNKSKTEFDNYSAEVDKLHANKSKYLAPKTKGDSQAILNFQKSLRDLLNSIIENNINEREIFTTVEIDEVNDEKFAEGYVKVPNGILLKLTKEKDFSDYRNVDLSYSISYDTDYFKNYVMTNYYKSYMNQAKYLIENSRYDGVEEIINKAIELKPDAQEPKQLLEKLEQVKNK